MRRLRLRLGLTQLQLAEAAGVSRAAVASIEGGRYRSHKIETLGAIARALGLGGAMALMVEVVDTQ